MMKQMISMVYNDLTSIINQWLLPTPMPTGRTGENKHMFSSFLPHEWSTALKNHAFCKVFANGLQPSSSLPPLGEAPLGVLVAQDLTTLVVVKLLNQPWSYHLCQLVLLNAIQPLNKPSSNWKIVEWYWWMVPLSLTMKNSTNEETHWLVTMVLMVKCLVWWPIVSGWWS